MAEWNSGHSKPKTGNLNYRIEAKTTRVAKAGMAHLPAEPRTGHCCHGPVRRPDHWLRPALCFHHCASGPQRPRLVQRYKSSDGGMDCASDNGGISLG